MTASLRGTAGALLLFALAPPARAGSLSGQVLASIDQSPLQDAIVVAYDLRLGYSYTTTDAEGRWTLDELPAGAWRLRVLPSSTDAQVSRFWPATRDYCTAEILWLAADEDRTGLDFRLESGGSSQGRLVDQQGQPVSGARVAAQGADATVTGLFRETLSDEDGRFVLQGLDTIVGEATRWTCEVEVEGWPDQYLGGIATYSSDEAETFEVEAGVPTDLGDLTLLDGIAIGGRVEGPDGPVADATVHVYSNGQIRSVLSDEDGRYGALGLPPGQVLVWTSPEGLATTYYPDVDRPQEMVDVLEEGEIREDLDLLAPAEAVLRARFLGAGDGVRGMLYNSSFSVGKGSSTDADGLLTIDGLHGGSYSLFAWGYAEDLVNQWLGEVEGEPTPFDIPAGKPLELEITLPPGARLSGSLRDELGGPVYGAGVFVTPAEGGDTWSTLSDREGSWTLGGLPPGSWRLEVSYGEYCGSDPGFVPLAWPGVPDANQVELLELGSGEAREGLDFVLPSDDEHDGMADRWERSSGLDPDRDDSAEDPDEDGYSNLEEYLMGSDPLDAEAGGAGCGCASTGTFPRLRWLAVLPLALAWRRRPARGRPSRP